MQPTRRNFLLGTGATLLASALERVAADGASVSLPPDIQLLLQSSGFNSNDPNSALLAVLGDVHINLDPSDAKFTDRFDDRLVAELNSLSPAITDLAIAGDLIVHHSVSIGGNRYPSNYALSRLEFREARNQLARFRAGMRVYAVPGNHDTDRFEEDAELWREELQLPPYQKCTLGGVPVFLLNSGHAGVMNATQVAWFQQQASLIPSDQEVLIIAHHPSFFYVYEEIGLKRTVYQAFARHRAPVWLVGGHGHAFGEQRLVSGEANFVQMEVTNGNPKQGGDGRSPGYVLLALQDGRVIHRLFRSINETTFESKQPLEQFRAYPLRWIFDGIEFPVALFEEGLYNRADHLVEVVAIDLKSHFSTCRSYTVRLNLAGAEGKIREFLLPANIWKSYVPPTCSFSKTGADGSWVGVSMTSSDAHQVYRVAIPETFQDSQVLYVNIKTQLQGLYDGISVYGWGLASDSTALTGYEKWLSTHYRTILPGILTNSNTKPGGSSLTNIQHFAFNVPLPAGISSATQAIIPPGTNPLISATPSYSRSFRTVMTFRFARRTAASEPLVTYAVEHSADLTQWTTVRDDRFSVTSLESGWEEVLVNLASASGVPAYCRVRITNINTGGGSVAHITAGDLDGNGIDDMTQYAFDLDAGNGQIRPYDPHRSGRKAGLPIQNVRSGLYSMLRFARLRNSSNPGVNYTIEQTANLRDWTPTPKSGIAERIIRSSGDWEEVEATILDTSPSFRFYRVGLTVSPS
jgi:hypothetical protein